MKPLERLTHRASFRTGIIVLVAMMCLALSPTSARSVAPAVLATTAIGAVSATPAAAETNGTAIRPFRVNVPDAALADLRKRVLATRWPDKETVSDRSQGVQLAKLQELVRYWGTGDRPGLDGLSRGACGSCSRTPCRLQITQVRELIAD